jgi:hypothetical protein
MAAVWTHPEADEDIWRTWFIEECEKSLLFGVNRLHLRRIEGYRIGTLFFFEDAPYFHQLKKEHLIFGPYLVATAASSNATKEVQLSDRTTGQPIIFREPYPENGPWFDRPHVMRCIEGHTIRFAQQASRFNHFPFRFNFTKASDWRVVRQEHTDRCQCGDRD